MPEWRAVSESAFYAVLPPWRLTSELQLFFLDHPLGTIHSRRAAEPALRCVSFGSFGSRCVSFGSRRLAVSANIPH
ncbi:MAG: hypothetical protein ACHP7J_07390, partial [Terriglobales bacterium]